MNGMSFWDRAVDGAIMQGKDPLPCAVRRKEGMRGGATGKGRPGY